MSEGEPRDSVLVCTECAREAWRDEHGCCDMCGEDKVHEIWLDGLMGGDGAREKLRARLLERGGAMMAEIKKADPRLVSPEVRELAEMALEAAAALAPIASAIAAVEN